MLDFRIQTFLCVCRHMNYTKAAGELGLTQPAVTQHIQYLEEQMGVRLFRYANRRLSLTAQGVYLKQALETLQHDTLRIRQELHSLRERPHVEIGATLSIGDFYLPEKLAAFLQQSPELNVSLTTADTAALLRRLDEGALDFALCEGYFNKSEYGWQPIRTERICGFVRADLPQAGCTRLEELFSTRLLLREPGSGTREIFEQALHAQGYALSCFASRCEISSPGLILQMLLAGQGVSFLYECVAQKQVQAGLLRPLALPGFPLSHDFNLVWKKNSMFAAQYRAWMERFL